MSGFLVQFGAQVSCAHSGQAKPTSSNSKVMVDGKPTVLMSTPFTISGCSYPPPTAGNGPCVTGLLSSGTTKVLSNGQPLAIQSSQGTCAPTGTSLTISSTQTRVSAM